MSPKETTILEEIRRQRPELARRADEGSALAAIRIHCLECVAGIGSEVVKCTSPKCSLFAYRLGRSPRVRVLTDEQKAAAVANGQRLAAKAAEARAAKAEGGEG